MQEPRALVSPIRRDHRPERAVAASAAGGDVIAAVAGGIRAAVGAAGSSPSRHNKPRTGTHGHSHGRSQSWRNCCGCSCWRHRRRDPRRPENWPGRRDRGRAVRRHHRDEADHRRSRAEVHRRDHGREGQRQVRPEDHRREDRRRLDPEEDHRHRGQEENQRGQAKDPEEGQTVRTRHLAR